MDPETSDLRTSRLGSRLPAPRAIPKPSGSISAGLTELSDSQHNARSQIAMPPSFNKGIKRDLPQPAQASEAKRKPLSQRAGEYPTKPTTAAPSLPRPNVQGISLVGTCSGIKQPSRYGSNRPHPHITDKTRRRILLQASVPTAELPLLPAQDLALQPQPVRPEEEDGQSDNAWDVDGRLGNIEQQFDQLKSIIGDATSDREALGSAVEMYKSRVSELQNERADLLRRMGELNSDTNRYRDEVSELRRNLDEVEWRNKNEIEALQRANDHARDDFQRSIDAEVERLNKSHQEELEAIKRHYAAELEDERRDKGRQVDEMRRQISNQQQDMHGDLQKKNTEISDLRSQMESLKGDLDREATLKSTLQLSLAEMSAANVTMEAKMNSLRSQIEFLESDSKAQSDSFADMEARLQEAHRIADEAKQKLIKEETERRVLFNKYQELKGNIRVMCRVRPVLDTTEGSEALIQFPDEKTSAKIGVLGPEEKSSLGNVVRKEYPFEFDRVFTPSIRNEEVFGEISQLVQSALDGYNVCIFCYGQTGSGKTFTMSSTDGMIPRATHMIYETIKQLEEKSWTYTMEGSFIEVYNEELHDLLTPNGREAPKSSTFDTTTCASEQW
ncbi:unnamed protein product [Parascedosporium putredinis]|uniref:Kinesin motor domain-containing protein n=1 Tax=Parascedosporium putredinis TaxID=1442378 RepID=A0A9P1GZN6_9PEZI|nr:unnamed protein product [Parascedosporium putredinis]CAI7991282.1 unnamed protein product [Parascedosporium putredinis]